MKNTIEFRNHRDDTPLRVTVYTSPESAFWVNSYLIETAEGLVVVDTQFTLTEARNLLDCAHATNKPLLAVLLTHPHPDHVNGTGILCVGLNSAPVVATQATQNAIGALAEPKRKQWKPILGDDYPDETVLPDHLVVTGESVVFGGVTFRFTDVGPAESLNESIIELPDYKVAFVGDLFYHSAHPWLVEGRTAQWLKALKVAGDRYAAYETLLSGHGPPAGPSAIDEQADYIEKFIALVEGEASVEGTVPEEGQDRIKTTLDSAYPGWALVSLHNLNIAGVAAELTSFAHSPHESNWSDRAVSSPEDTG